MEGTILRPMRWVSMKRCDCVTIRTVTKDDYSPSFPLNPTVLTGPCPSAWMRSRCVGRRVSEERNEILSASAIRSYVFSQYGCVRGLRDHAAGCSIDTHRCQGAGPGLQETGRGIGDCNWQKEPHSLKSSFQAAATSRCLQLLRSGTRTIPPIG